MKTINNLDEFNEAIKQDKAVVNFSAPAWCGPCKMFEPIYRAVSEKVDVPLYFVDVDVAPDVAAEVGIAKVPTVLHYSNGEQKGMLQATGTAPFTEQVNNL